MPLFSVLERLNFNGKVVKPFTTHEGSMLGDIMTDVNKLCPFANIKNGLAIKGSNALNCDNELEKWI